MDFSVSVDKIKIKGKFKTKHYKDFPHKTKVSLWCTYCLPTWIECIKEFPENFHPFKYRWSFVLRCKGDNEGVFYISEWYNGDFKESRECPDKFLIEYNPNKSGAKIYEEFCNNFIFRITDIVSCDLAFDIPNVDISSVRLDTRCDVMTYGKTNNATYYIAPKEDESGRVKVYQKDVERETKGKDFAKTLRIEVSLKGDFLSTKTIHLNHEKTYQQLSKAVEHLNSVKIKQGAASTDDWKVLALSLLSPEDLQKCFSLMDRKTRSSYRSRITESTYVCLALDVPTLCGYICDSLKLWQRRVKI